MAYIGLAAVLAALAFAITGLVQYLRAPGSCAHWSAPHVEGLVQDQLQSLIASGFHEGREATSITLEGPPQWRAGSPGVDAQWRARVLMNFEARPSLGLTAQVSCAGKAEFTF